MWSYTHYQPAFAHPTHVSHLIPLLGWTGTQETLLTAMAEAHARAERHHQSFGLGAPGPYDLLVHPRAGSCSLVLVLHGRPMDALTSEEATRLLPIIGGNGCGPDDSTALLDDVRHSLALAQAYRVPVELCYASLCNLFVQPTGHWIVTHPESFFLVTLDQGPAPGLN